MKIAEIFRANLDGIDAYRRLYQGELVREGDDVYSNGCSLPNTYYTDILRKYSHVISEHSVLSFIIGVGYYATHWSNASKAVQYASSQVRQKPTDADD